MKNAELAYITQDAVQAAAFGYTLGNMRKAGMLTDANARRMWDAFSANLLERQMQGQITEEIARDMYAKFGKSYWAALNG